MPLDEWFQTLRAKPDERREYRSPSLPRPIRVQNQEFEKRTWGILLRPCTPRIPK